MLVPMKYKSVEDILIQAEKSYTGEPQYKYAYLLGALEQAYKDLCNKVEIWHNQPLKEEKLNNQ